MALTGHGLILTSVGAPHLEKAVAREEGSDHMNEKYLHDYLE